MEKLYKNTILSQNEVFLAQILFGITWLVFTKTIQSVENAVFSNEQKGVNQKIINKLRTVTGLRGIQF